MSSDGRPERPQESKIALTDRLRREGRWEAATLFKDAVFEELRSAGIRGQQAKDTAWAEMARRFPPLPPAEPVVEESEADDEEELPLSGSALPTDESFGMLPGDWPPLPEKAAWIDELEWAYQNGFFVIAEKATGAVVYRWERARTPAPSRGSLVLMKLLAESRQKFMDLLGKAKTSTDGTETDVEKREKRRVDEIRAMIEKLSEEDCG